MQSSPLIRSAAMRFSIQASLWIAAAVCSSIFHDDKLLCVVTSENQANIANLFRVVELGGTEFPYQSDGGVCRIYTAAEIAQIYIAAQTLITTQTTYHNALKAYVQSLEGAEEISSITYGMTLPEPYLSEMNAKLAVAQAQMNAITEKLGN